MARYNSIVRRGQFDISSSRVLWTASSRPPGLLTEQTATADWFLRSVARMGFVYAV